MDTLVAIQISFHLTRWWRCLYTQEEEDTGGVKQIRWWRSEFRSSIFLMRWWRLSSLSLTAFEND